MDGKPTWNPTWHAMDNVSRPTGFCIKPTSQNWETKTLQNLTILDILLLTV